MMTEGANAGRAEVGSCLTDATREGRSRCAVRGVPLCRGPNACDGSRCGDEARWFHANPHSHIQPCIFRIAKRAQSSLTEIKQAYASRASHLIAASLIKSSKRTTSKRTNRINLVTHIRCSTTVVRLRPAVHGARTTPLRSRFFDLESWGGYRAAGGYPLQVPSEPLSWESHQACRPIRPLQASTTAPASC